MDQGLWASLRLYNTAHAGVYRSYLKNAICLNLIVKTKKLILEILHSFYAFLTYVLNQ
jgi:hypothetical protein